MSTASAPSAMPDYSVTFVPPRGWKETDLSPKGREKQIDAMVAPLVGKVAQEQTLIPMLREALRTTLRNAWQSGVRYSIATTPETYAPLNVIASYTVAVLPHAAPTGTQADDLETIARSLLDGESEHDPHDGDIVELTKVKVPGIGLGVRAVTKLMLSAQASSDHSDATSVPVTTLRTFLPFARGIIVATGTAYQEIYADELVALFDAMTQTLRVVDSSSTSAQPSDAA